MGRGRLRPSPSVRCNATWNRSDLRAASPRSPDRSPRGVRRPTPRDRG